DGELEIGDALALLDGVEREGALEDLRHGTEARAEGARVRALGPGAGARAGLRFRIRGVVHLPDLVDASLPEFAQAAADVGQQRRPLVRPPSPSSSRRLAVTRRLSGRLLPDLRHHASASYRLATAARNYAAVVRRRRPSSGARNWPVYEPGARATSSGVPAATIWPPRAPPSGPR